MKKLLVITSAILALSSVNVMAADYNKPQTAVQTTVGEKIDDAKIVTVINADFVKDDELSAIQINVDSTKGNVILRGIVPSKTAKERAEKIAKSAEGVGKVDNRLEVTNNGSIGNSIANRNLDKHQGETVPYSAKNEHTMKNEVHVNDREPVNKGINQAGIKKNATEMKRDVKDNAETVGDKIDDAGTNVLINTAFAADKDLSAFKIDVDVKDGKAWLKGTAPSLEAKNRATDIARKVGGVTTVHNELIVTK